MNAAADETPSDRVVIRVTAPVVTISPAAAGRHFVDLPALEYAFEVVTDCGDGGMPDSLSINVADTHATLPAAAFEDSPTQHLVLRIPARQTAPVAVHGFCTDASTPAGRATKDRAGLSLAARVDSPDAERLTLPDILSAQVSLVCSDGDQRRMTYVSQPLGVSLACASAIPDSSGDPVKAGGRNRD
ncbi:MAG TPA: hypothetical protein VE175_03995 [Woeseiaceae bacterium]|nr:hypothetical protein [Woeseiaceae bacterium]